MHKVCCGNCHYCDFFAYTDEDGEHQAYWGCRLNKESFDFDNGFCDDYE